MPTQSSIHFYLNWAKDRIDEMDATLASLQSKVGEVQADAESRQTKPLLTCAKNVMTSGTPSRSSRKPTRPLGIARRHN